MPTYPKTGSVLGGGVRTALSTQIIIMVENEPVGAVQSITVKQGRTAKEITEIGTDGNIEIVPTSPTKIDLTIDRIVYDGLSISEAFSRGFVNLNAQRIAFDIVVIDQYTGTGDNAVITTYHNCWFTSISKNYKVSDYIVSENAAVKCTHMSSLRGGEAVALSQGVGGGRQIDGVQIDSVEGAADSGQRLGALDWPGLISAIF